ncbi:TonB-dependent receptor, partial [Sphingobium sp. LMC3-1-1.1]
MSLELKSILRDAASIVTIFVLLPAVAQAEKNPAPQSKASEGGMDNGEIVVTAQHREQRLQDVGISITALGSEQLARLGVTSSIDIGRI